MSLKNGSRQLSKELRQLYEGQFGNRRQEISADVGEGDQTPMLPRTTHPTVEEEEEEDSIQGPTTPWLQPLQWQSSDGRGSGPGSGNPFSGHSLLDGNAWHSEEGALSSPGPISPLAGSSPEDEPAIGHLGSSQGAEESIGAFALSAASTMHSSGTSKRVVLVQPKSSDAISAEPDKRAWVANERRSRSYDQILGFFKSALPTNWGPSNARDGDTPHGSSSVLPDSAPRTLDSSGRSLRGDLDSSVRSAASAADEQGEPPIARIARESSNGNAEVESSGAAKSFLSKIKSSLALLPRTSEGYMQTRSPDPTSSPDSIAPCRTHSDPATSGRRGHSLDNARQEPTPWRLGVDQLVDPARNSGRSLDLRPPALLDVSAHVLAKASADVERRRASLLKQAGSPQSMWHTSPTLRSEAAPTQLNPISSSTRRLSNIASHGGSGLLGGRHASMETPRASTGALRMLQRSSRDNQATQSWAPNSNRLPDMGSMRARMSLDMVRRAYVQSRENNLLASYETVLTPTGDDTPRESLNWRRSQTLLSPPLEPLPSGQMVPPPAVEQGPQQYKPRMRDGSVPFHPNDSTRMLWDALMFVCTVFALIVDPISLAFVGEIGRFSFLNISDRFVTAVFMLDIIMNFLTGHVDKKEMKVIMHWRVVVLQYTKFWLWIDLVSSLPPEAFAAIAGSDFTDNNNLLRGARISKILRCFKVSRLARLVEKFQLNFDIRISHFAWKISAWACACFLYLHWTTCAECWVWVFADAPRRDIDLGSYGQFEGGDEECLASSLCNARYYLRGLRSAIAFMCGHGQETGQSLPEDLIAVICSLLGSILYSSFIAVAISLLMEMDAERVQYMGKVERLNHYMGRRKVPLALRRRVREYMETTWRQGGGDDLEVLGYVSRSLRREMVMHNFQELLANVPFFKSGTPGFYACLGSLLRPESFMKGERVMIKGEIGQEMFILERGFVRVVPDGYEEEAVLELLDEEDDELGSLQGLLTPGAYFGEVALVEKTLRTATILAATAGTVLVLDRDAYEERIVRYFPDIAREVEKAARDMIKDHSSRRSMEMSNLSMRSEMNSLPNPSALGGIDVNAGLIPGRPFYEWGPSRGPLPAERRRLSDVHEEPGSGVAEEEDHTMRSLHGSSFKGSVSESRPQAEEPSAGRRDLQSVGRQGSLRHEPTRAPSEAGSEVMSRQGSAEVGGEGDKMAPEEIEYVLSSFGDGDLLEKPSRRSQPPAHTTAGALQVSPPIAPDRRSPVESSPLSGARSRMNSHLSRKNSHESAVRSAEAAAAEHIFEKLSSELAETQKEEIIDMFEAFGNGDLVEKKPRQETLSRRGSTEREPATDRRRKSSKKGSVIPF